MSLCVGFCHTTMQTSCNYTWMVSLVGCVSPGRHRGPPGSPALNSSSPQLSVIYTIAHTCRCAFLSLSPSLLP